MSSILNRELKDAKTLWSPKLSEECTRLSVQQIRANIRLKHREIELHIICFQGNPLTPLLLINLKEILNPVFNEVVFRVDAIIVDSAFLLMLDTVNTQDSRLLHHPVNHFFTEALIIAFVPCKVLITAHRHRTCEDRSMIIQGLVAADECQLLTNVTAFLNAFNFTGLS